MTELTQNFPDDEGGPGRRRIHLREITGDGELPLETVGQDLRAARLRRGDDLATVSKALKIRKDHLEALEEDSLDKLPGKTYAIGFVRTYSQYLGLDAAALVERFKQEISGRTEPSVLQPTTTTVHEEEPRRLPQGWRLIGLAVVALLVWGAWHLFSVDRETSQATPPPPVMTPPKVQVAKPAPPPQATPSPAIDATGIAPGGASPSPALSAPTPAPSSQQAAIPSPAAGAQATGPAVAPAGKVYGAQNKDARVVLRVRTATHVTVKGRDGTMFINRDLVPGDTYNVRNIPGMTLSTSNGGGVEIDLDGVAMGNAGPQMQPADNVLLDPQSIVDHFNSHRPG